MKNKDIYIKIVLPVAIIVLALVLIFNSGLMGKSVYSACTDTDNTIVSTLGEVETDDASIFVKGNVSYGYTTLEDVCAAGSGSKRVIEFFCDSGHRNSREVSCPGSCIDGACKK